MWQENETPARHSELRDDGSVKCGLCPHACLIKPGRRGVCAVRENKGGRLVALTYARAIALHNDPIEKKPLFHVLPGSVTTSVAAAGCNLRCAHCQNHDISQLPARTGEIPGRTLPPGAVVDEATRVGAQTVAFTYTEPTVFFEWAYDIAEAAASRGIRSVSVTNGFTNPAPLRELAPLLLAANVDLKSFDDAFYRDVCGGRLQPVCDAIALLRGLGVFVEVTTLLIPGRNDGEAELARMSAFLASVDRNMPWHLSRFHPDNEMLDRPPTPVGTLHQAAAIGRAAGLRFVYTGNVPGDSGEHTDCPGCGARLITRRGFQVIANRIAAGRCPDCGAEVPGVWS